MVRFAQTEYNLEPIVQLVDTEEEYMQYLLENFAPPPTAALSRVFILNKEGEGEENQENPTTD